ncbi:hypothetical protein ABS71_06590 [bacterium SCN 62-11]|nr:MAG: hypothetical protein ABS71_06590 [bacterium SCN 62-11]
MTFQVIGCYKWVAKRIGLRYHGRMKVPDRQALAANIAHFRHLQRWSQRDLAAALHVHQTMVARWEAGGSTPRRDTIAKIAEALEITPEELVTPRHPGQEAAHRFTEDPELNRLIGLVNSFEARDRDALKTFLEAIAMKNRMKAAMSA